MRSFALLVREEDVPVEFRSIEQQVELAFPFSRCWVRFGIVFSVVRLIGQTELLRRQRLKKRCTPPGCCFRPAMPLPLSTSPLECHTHQDICHHRVNGSDGIGGGRPGISGRRQIANRQPIKNTSKKRNIRSPRCSLGSKIAEKSKTKNTTVPTCREVRSHSIPAFPESRSHPAPALIDFILPPFRYVVTYVSSPRHRPMNPGSAQQEWRDSFGVSKGCLIIKYFCEGFLNPASSQLKMTNHLFRIASAS